MACSRQDLKQLVDFILMDIEVHRMVGKDLGRFEKQMTLRLFVLHLKVRWKRPIIWKQVNEAAHKRGYEISKTEFNRERRRMSKVKSLADSIAEHGEGIIEILVKSLK